jgi:hypothetical protein
MTRCVWCYTGKFSHKRVLGALSFGRPVGQPKIEMQPSLVFSPLVLLFSPPSNIKMTENEEKHSENEGGKLNIYPLALLSAFNLQGGRPGIFIAPFLLASGWREGRIGQALATAGLVKMCCQAPFGYLIDSTRYKRSWPAAANAVTIIACVIMLYSEPTYLLFTCCLVAQGMGEAAAYPGLYSLTLGMVPTKIVAAQIGLNETSNHLGNMSFAVLASLSIYASSTVTAESEGETEARVDIVAAAGLDGGKFLFIVIGMGCIALLLLLLGVDPQDINHDRACGLQREKEGHELLPLSEAEAGASTDMTSEKTAVRSIFRSAEVPVASSSPSSVLNQLRSIPTAVYLFYLCIGLFHLANAAMLPLLSQSQPAITGTAIIVSQITMVGSASLCSVLLPTWGTRILLAVCFACIPLRGALLVYILRATPVHIYVYMLLTQVLDGIAGGIFGVIAVGSAATYAKSTHSALQGRFSMLVGAVKTMECLGASFSNLLGACVHVLHMCTYVQDIY